MLTTAFLLEHHFYFPCSFASYLTYLSKETQTSFSDFQSNILLVYLEVSNVFLDLLAELFHKDYC